MGKHRGYDGVVKTGTDAIAQVRSWSIDEQGETEDDTVMGGDGWRTHQHTLKAWNGDATCFYDPDDTNGQVALTIGSSITLNLYPEDDTTGNSEFSGTATVTGITRSGSVDGIIEQSFTFQGNGALSKGDAA